MIQPSIAPSTDPHTGIADDAPVLFGTDGDDFMQGGSDSDVIAGVAGDDALYGGAGNDDLDGGQGNDQLHGQGGNDVLNGGPGMDMLYGGPGQNVLRGGTGNDIYLAGGFHSHDVIDNGAGGAAPGENDMVLFYNVVSPGQVVLSRKDDDLMIQVAHTDSSSRVVGYFNGDGSTTQAVAELKFSDGATWNIDRVKNRVLRGSADGDRLIGYATPDRIDGKGGNDVIKGGGGGDLLLGGEGDDVLDGGDGNDVLYGGGGGGNDRLVGGAGSDIYVFERGAGNDLIVGTGNKPGDVDCVHVEGSIEPIDIWFRRAGDDLVLSIIGSTDSLSLKDWFAGGAAGFDRIALDNEKFITPDKIDVLVAAMAAMPMPSSTAIQPIASGQGQLAMLSASSWVGAQGGA